MSRIFVLIIAIFGVHLVCSQQKPTVLISRLGDSVNLICNYDSDLPLSWVKLDRQPNSEPVVLTVANRKIIPNSRFTLNHTYAESEYSLKIDNIQEVDDGTYRCALTVHPFDKFAVYDLNIVRPAFIYDNSSFEMVVHKGTNVKLECYAGGYPVPKVYWRRRNQELLPTGKPFYNGNILNIPEISEKDRGSYFCCAQNNVGRGVRRIVKVDMLFAPVITVPKTMVGQIQHREAKITCHIESNPEATVVWFYKGLQLDTNRHYSLEQLSEEQDASSMDATLTITSVVKCDYGEYTCKASNIYGTSEATVVLYEVII